MTNSNNWHLTAKERDKISFPTNWLEKNNYLHGKILDFGCGYGIDVSDLKKRGYDSTGYDKFYFPVYPNEKFNTIICQYVLNVIQTNEQHEVIMEISQLLEPGGVAFFTVRRDLKYEGYRMHKIHKQPTFQCNVILPFKSVFVNEFCEIYSFTRIVDNPVKSSCLFCRPSSKLKFIAESVHAFAAYDGFPVSEGHTLIITKKHIANYFELTQKEQFHLLLLLNFVQRFLQKEFNPDGFNVGINVDHAAGQSIPHVHIHLIPRYKGDVQNPKGGIRHIISGKGYY